MVVRPTSLFAFLGLSAIIGAIVVALLAAPSSSAGRPAPGPDPLLAEWPGWPYRATCGYMGFDPVRVFSGFAAAEEGDGAPETALREMLARDFPFRLPDHGWRLATRRNGRALFLHGRLGTEMETPNELLDMELERRGGRWQMRTGGGFCNMFTVAPGRQSSLWSLAPKQPPLGPQTRHLWVITGARCSRKEKPPRVSSEFVEIGGRLVMTLWPRYDRSAVGAFEICDPRVPPWPPVKVDLPEPLGDRELYDGAFFPPLPARRYEPPRVIPL